MIWRKNQSNLGNNPIIENMERPSDTDQLGDELDDENEKDMKKRISDVKDALEQMGSIQASVSTLKKYEKQIISLYETLRIEKIEASSSNQDKEKTEMVPKPVLVNKEYDQTTHNIKLLEVIELEDKN